MASVRFYLKDHTAKESSIYCLYDIRTGERMKYYIGEKIRSSAWNKRDRRPKAGLEYGKLSNLIDIIEKNIKDIIIDFKINGENIDAATLKIELKKKLGMNIPEDKPKKDLISFLEVMIDRREKSPRFKNSGVRNYKLLKSKLKGFQKHTGQKFNIEDITLNWYNGFIDYLYTEVEASINYAASMSNKLKTVLRTAVEVDNISTNRVYENKRFSTNEIYVPKIYLTEEEIDLIYSHEYDSDKLRNAVNLYVVDCHTGLRFADLNRVDISKDVTFIEGKEMLKVTTSKTAMIVIIPLHPIIKEISLNSDIRKISNVNLNAYIKEAAQEAGITQTVQKISYPSGQMKREYVPKYSQITVHTARRSFATNMFKRGVPVRSIMMMTGHKSEKQFLKYLRLSIEENAVKVAKDLDQ